MRYVNRSKGRILNYSTRVARNNTSVCRILEKIRKSRIRNAFDVITMWTKIRPSFHHSTNRKIMKPCSFLYSPFVINNCLWLPISLSRSPRSSPTSHWNLFICQHATCRDPGNFNVSIPSSNKNATYLLIDVIHYGWVRLVLLWIIFWHFEQCTGIKTA